MVFGVRFLKNEYKKHQNRIKIVNFSSKIAKICIIRLKIDDIVHFDYMDAPTPETMMRALEELYRLGAITFDGALTETGRHMAEFPLNPELSKVVLSAGKYGVLEEAIILVAMLSVPAPFMSTRNNRNAQRAQGELTHATGDHLSLVGVYRAYEANLHDKDWAWSHWVSDRAMAQAANIVRQIIRLTTRIGLQSERESKDVSSDLRRAILEGYFMQVAHINPGGKAYTTVGPNAQVVTIHPSSFLDSKPEWLIWHELAVTDQRYVRTVSSVWPDMLLEVAEDYFHPDKKNIGGLAKEALEKAVEKMNRAQNTKGKKRKNILA